MINFVEVFAAVAAIYALVIIATFIVAKNLSVEYALFAGPLIDTPNKKAQIVRLVLVTLLYLTVSHDGLWMVILASIIISLFLRTVLNRLWFTSWMSYGLQLIACAVMVQITLSPASLLVVIGLMLVADYISRQPIRARYKRFICHMYFKLTERYQPILPSKMSLLQSSTLFNIMIAEEMNRPVGLRVLEWLAKLTRYRNRALTMGIMQVSSQSLISDKQSVLQAVEIIIKIDKSLVDKTINDRERGEYIAYQYNGSKLYVDRFYKQIYNITHKIE